MLVPQSSQQGALYPTSGFAGAGPVRLPRCGMGVPCVGASTYGVVILSEKRPQGANSLSWVRGDALGSGDPSVGRFCPWVGVY